MADDNKFSDDSNVTLPIRNLVSIAAAIAVSTWAYYGVIERLNVIEQKLEAHWEEIEENDNWIDEWTPPASVQENIERVRDLELQMVRIQTMLEHK
jgi:hypothetical protein